MQRTGDERTGCFVRSFHLRCTADPQVSHPVRMADWSGPGRHAGRLDEAVLAAQAWRVEETLVMAPRSSARNVGRAGEWSL